MSTESPEIAREAIFEIIENQLRDNTPPITNKTFSRLKSEGHSHEETFKLIGCVLVAELNEIMKSEQPFNEERYSAHLEALPKLPWEGE